MGLKKQLNERATTSISKYEDAVKRLRRALERQHKLEGERVVQAEKYKGMIQKADEYAKAYGKEFDVLGSLNTQWEEEQREVLESQEAAKAYKKQVDEANKLLADFNSKMAAAASDTTKKALLKKEFNEIISRL